MDTLTFSFSLNSPIHVPFVHRCGVVTLGVFVVVCSSPVLRSMLWGLQPASTPFPVVLSTSRRYYHVSIGVAPKRAALAAASEELQVAKTKLADAETQLADVMKKIHDLETSYNNAVTKKQELEEEMERCKIRLASAMKLIGGLGGEEARWQSSSEALTVSFNQLSGSVVRVDAGVGLCGLRGLRGLLCGVELPVYRANSETGLAHVFCVGIALTLYCSF